MPFNVGASMNGGDLADETRSLISTVLGSLDDHVREMATHRGLYPAQVRLLQPLQYCVIAGDEIIFVVVSNLFGGIPTHQYIDWSGKQMDLESAVHIVERDLAFKNPFGFQFPRNVIDLPEEEKPGSIAAMAEKLIDEEIHWIERLSRIVRIAPIFQGRDFMLNDGLVFVLSPFSEPFNTIFADHIKPTVENRDGRQINCIRANDIYDNRPIIEDIWRQINEARIVISELTGRNPNVFYETGIAHTVGKEVILITQTMDDVPFDLRHLRSIVYDYTPRGMNIFESNIENTIAQILNRN